MLVGLDWCQTYVLGLGIWKKMKNKKGAPKPFLSRASIEAHKPPFVPKPQRFGRELKLPMMVVRVWLSPLPPPQLVFFSFFFFLLYCNHCHSKTPQKNTHTHQGDLKKELPLPLLSPLHCYNNYINCYSQLCGNVTTTFIDMGRQ